MFRTDGQGNLYILSDNSGVISIRELHKTKGKLVAVFDGDEEVRKEYPINGQEEVLIKLSQEDIDNIGIGEHIWYVDLVSEDGKDVDTIVYQKIVVVEKDSRW